MPQVALQVDLLKRKLTH